MTKQKEKKERTKSMLIMKKISLNHNKWPEQSIDNKFEHNEHHHQVEIRSKKRNIYAEIVSTRRE